MYKKIGVSKIGVPITEEGSRGVLYLKDSNDVDHCNFHLNSAYCEKWQYVCSHMRLFYHPRSRSNWQEYIQGKCLKKSTKQTTCSN